MAERKCFIERRLIKVVFSRIKNATGGISTGCKLALPKRWMDSMGISTEDRQLNVDFDPQSKTIMLSKSESNDSIILTKDILKSVGAKSSSEFSIFIDKKAKSIMLINSKPNRKGDNK